MIPISDADVDSDELDTLARAYRLREAADHLRAYVDLLQRVGAVSESTARHLVELAAELRRMAKDDAEATLPSRHDTIRR